MSTITPTTHRFYDKHDPILKALWNLNRSATTVDEKLAQLKDVIGSNGVTDLVDIYHEETGESRARVTPLIIACFEGDYDVIKLLIDSNFNPNQTETEHDLTALHILVDVQYKGQTITEQQRAELIRLLISKGANVNHPDKRQMTPIHKVAFNNQLECLDALIEANVDPNGVYMGQTALDIAARYNRDGIIKKLLDYSVTKKDIRNQTGATPLHLAAAGIIDTPECVDLLINAGLSVNSQDQRGNTPVMVACFFHRPCILASLVAAKADLSIKNNEGKDAASICDDASADECKAILQNAQQ